MDDAYDNIEETDYTQHFHTTACWTTSKEMVDYLNQIAFDLGFFLSISSSAKNDGCQTPRCIVRCESSGSYRATNTSTKKTGTKKCNCPFKIKGYVEGNFWKCYVDNGNHNHNPYSYPQGHARAARLKEPEIELVKSMYKTSCKAREILEAVQEQYPNNMSNVKTIHNCSSKYKLKETGGRSQVQQLLFLLHSNSYIYHYRSNEETDTLEDLFFAHPKSITLFRAYPHVLLMDCTYRTNRFDIPFFEIVGVTSTQQSFCVGFVFLHSERQTDYIWALQCLRKTLEGCLLPRVILTDRDLALMNSIDIVFPDSNALLCTFHISRNVAANCRTKVQKECWDEFSNMWHNIVDSGTVKDFEKNLTEMQSTFDMFPAAMKYVTDLLRDYKEKFVACWTNKTMHLGNRTTNRVEGQHSKLKKYLKNSKGSLHTVWGYVDQILNAQWNTIKMTLEKSQSYHPHAFNIPALKFLRNLVAAPALEKIVEEMERCQYVGTNRRTCQCQIRISAGLPCAHELSVYLKNGTPIPLNCIDMFWKKLDFNDSTSMSEAEGIEEEINEFRILYNEKNPSDRTWLKKKFLEVFRPEKTSMNEPEVNKSKKGRPRKDTSTKRDPSAFEYVEAWATQTSKVSTEVKEDPTKRSFIYKDKIPSLFHPHISAVNDVIPDGNCGFRAVAIGLGMPNGEEAWLQVRIQLIRELDANEFLYREMFGSDFDTTRQRLCWSDMNRSAPKPYWMCFPYAGYLIASCYNVAVVLIDIGGQTTTYLPLHSPPTDQPMVITLGYVNNNHFVEISAEQSMPMPPIALQWARYRSPDAEAWNLYFRQYFNFYVALYKRSNK